MQNLVTIIAPQLLVAGAYSFIGEIKGVVFELRWMLAFIVVMIVADFVLGIIDSVVKRGEDFRFSRAGRRTMCKFIQQLPCRWVHVGYIHPSANWNMQLHHFGHVWIGTGFLIRV